jgi:putative membrane protein insertion efficiency factor
MRVLRALDAALAAAVTAVVRAYQRFISPLVPPTCRFRPSCSQYMIQAVKKRGALVGVLKGMLRILRCNPFFPGGYDPVD